MTGFNIGDKVTVSNGKTGTVKVVYPDTDDVYIEFPAGSDVSGGYFKNRDITLA